MNRVAVVVLNYKGIEDTFSCIDSLLEQAYSDLTLVIVENWSNDGSAEKLRTIESQYKDKIVVLYNDKNLGFAGGVNTGIKWAIDQKLEYVALFNNDATADKNWLQALIGTATARKTGITTGLLLHEHGDTIDSTGDWYSIWGLPFPRSRGEKASLAPEAGYVFSASGGASLYSIKMLKEIGLFDDTFFAYYEDTDISFRAQLAGYRIYYEPKAIAYHKQGGTSSKMPGFTILQTFKNLPLLYVKNVPKDLLFKIGIRFWFAYLMMLGRAIVRGSAVPALQGYLQSVWLFWTSAIPKRRNIQRNKIVSNTYIRSLLYNDLPPDQTGLRALRNKFKRHQS